MENRFSNLPGLNFSDKIKLKHHVPQCFGFSNGYRKFNRPTVGIGNEPLKEQIEKISGSDHPIR